MIRTSLILSSLLLWAGSTAHAQTQRDSAGIRIVTSDQPAWRGDRALKLTAIPRLAIRADTTRLHGRIGGVVRLSNGSVVAVTSQDLMELHFFDTTGALLRSIQAPEGSRRDAFIEGVGLLEGDTIAVLASRGAMLFGPDGALERLVAAPAQAPPPWGRIVGFFPSGTSVAVKIVIPAPLPPGTRWIDSFPFFLASARDTSVIALGKFPTAERAMDGASFHQLWFGPVASWATAPGRLYYGYPSAYAINEYSEDGRLTRIIRRRWTPTPVTEADKDAHTIAWGKHWITSTGAEAEREHADKRDDPYATTVPAFAQMIVDDLGRLWVRGANIRDPDLVGEFNTSPVVPSTWSVFDTTGRWLSDITMPTGFLPSQIGVDFVLGVLRGDDGSRAIIVYGYTGGPGRTGGRGAN